MSASIQRHNQKPASVWNSGASRYEEISREIADSIEHCVMCLDPQPENALATGTGWMVGILGRRGALHEGFSTDPGICVPRKYWVTLGTRH